LGKISYLPQFHFSGLPDGEKGGGGDPIMYTHVSKCKNNKIKNK
jgi:hypothetical protein